MVWGQEYLGISLLRNGVTLCQYITLAASRLNSKFQSRLWTIRIHKSYVLFNYVGNGKVFVIE